MKLLNSMKALFTPKKISPMHLQIGKIGENAAAKYLRRHGYRVIYRNFVSGKNEIDIIAQTKDTYVFCEVKSRVQDYKTDSRYGRPISAVDKNKQRHLISAATTFERRHRKDGKFYRFDVIEVYLDENRNVCHVHHIENAFTR